MNQKEINKNSYNNISNKWNDYCQNRKINTCIKEFEEKLRSCSYILDVGCGCGYPIDSYLSQKGHIVTGIDISNNMLSLAKQNIPNVSFFECDFLEYASDILFDAIIAFDSIWHIEENKQCDIYKQISKLLKTGGYCLFTHGISGKTIKGSMFNEEFIYSSLDKETLLKTLDDNGLDIIIWEENYKEITTGTRDLLVVVKKR